MNFTSYGLCYTSLIYEKEGKIKLKWQAGYFSKNNNIHCLCIYGHQGGRRGIQGEHEEWCEADFLEVSWETHEMNPEYHITDTTFLFILQI